MGRAARPRPHRLAEKLMRIRRDLGLSQEAMAERLGGDPLTHASVSGYELGTREPPLTALLEYARAANVLVEALIDDELDLPDRLPANPKSEGIKRALGTKKAKGGGRRSS